MARGKSNLIKELDVFKKKWLQIINNSREMLLSNLAMTSQIPAKTFYEEKRAEFLQERFLATGINEPSIDDIYNVSAIINGRKNEKRILIYTHMDHQPEMAIDTHIVITKDKVIGCGVPEDNLALATLITIPDIIKRLGLEFDSEIILLASTRSHGRGDMEGLRRFIKKNKKSINYAINLVGFPLGTVNYFSLGRVRCDIICNIIAELGSPWNKLPYINANLILNEVINKLYSISIPIKPKTIINVGMISGGNRYSTISTHSEAKIEILGEDDKIMEEIIETISNQCIDTSAKYNVEVTSDFFGRYKATGLNYSHPMVKAAVQIVNSFGYKPTMSYVNTELSIPLSFSIPTICLGITKGVNTTNVKGNIEIKPIPNGVLQLIMMLYAIDRGYCDA